MGDASADDTSTPGAFEWWAPHGRALRRARALFLFGALIAALYVIAPFAMVVALVGDGSRRVVEVVVVGIAILFAVTGVVALVAWRGVPRAVLRFAHARPPEPDEVRGASRALESVALARGLARPAVWVVDDDAPNAFVIGRPGRAHVGFTRGALQLPADELEALCAFALAALASRTFALCTAAIDVVLVAEMCTRALWALGALIILSAIAGVPGALIAVVMLSLTALVLVTRLALVLADRALPRLLDDANGLVDLEAIGSTEHPQAYARLLQRVRTDGVRVASNWTIAHLWFDRDECELEPVLPLPRRLRALVPVPWEIDAPVLAQRCERSSGASMRARRARVNRLASTFVPPAPHPKPPGTRH